MLLRLALLPLLLAACPGSPDGRPDVGHTEPADAVAAPTDASAGAPDAGPPDFEDAADLPPDSGPAGDVGSDVGAPPTPLPLALSDTVLVGPPGAIDMTAAGFEGEQGPLVVFERFDADFLSAKHWVTRLEPAPVGGWSGAALLEPQPPDAFVAAPSSVEVGGERWLYGARASTLQGAAALFRARLEAAGFGAAQALPAIGGVGSLLAWPRFFDLPDGRVGVAFRDGASRPRLALSADGQAFATPVTVGPPGAMADACAFADGTLLFTYQTEDAPMTSWLRISRDDGATWTPAQKVTESSTNVHDTAPVRRLDGAVDLYYIYPAGGAGFSLFRRAVSAAGALGPEQQVTALEVGDTSKPGATRLRDGRLLLTWAEISARAPATGEPTEQRLWLALLSGDAPAP